LIPAHQDKPADVPDGEFPVWKMEKRQTVSVLPDLGDNNRESFYYWDQFLTYNSHYLHRRFVHFLAMQKPAETRPDIQPEFDPCKSVAHTAEWLDSFYPL